jgi:hypothetical protein
LRQIHRVNFSGVAMRVDFPRVFVFKSITADIPTVFEFGNDRVIFEKFDAFDFIAGLCAIKSFQFFSLGIIQRRATTRKFSAFLFVVM